MSDMSELMLDLQEEHDKELRAVVWGESAVALNVLHPLVIFRENGASGAWMVEVHLVGDFPKDKENLPTFEQCRYWRVLDRDLCRFMDGGGGGPFAYLMDGKMSKRIWAIMLMVLPELTRQEWTRYTENKMLRKMNY